MTIRANPYTDITDQQIIPFSITGDCIKGYAIVELLAGKTPVTLHYSHSLNDLDHYLQIQWFKKVHLSCSVEDFHTWRIISHIYSPEILTQYFKTHIGFHYYQPKLLNTHPYQMFVFRLNERSKEPIEQILGQEEYQRRLQLSYI